MKKLFFSFLIVGFVFLFQPVFASTSNGTIDPTYKYAWGENLGWVNFGTTNGNVQITDSALTGYLWSQSYGWINLAPTNSGQGVTNNCSGELSGQAWGENVGWIDFSGVTINSSGKFTGTAGTSSTMAGRINFDCTNCDVRTDWRPCASRSGGGSSGGSGGSSDIIPPYNISIKINDNATSTYVNQVNLTLLATEANQMMLSNTGDFAGATWEAYVSNKVWLLNGDYGLKTVYVKFRDSSHNVSTTTIDTIYYLSSTSTGADYLVSDTPSSTTGSTSCPLTTQIAYKLSTSPAVYYITKDCTKRAFNVSKVFFTYFKSWTDVKVTTSSTLNSIPNDKLGFMPWGPLYNPQYGALIKIPADPKVYLLLGGSKYWITSEEVFNKLNYKWNWIEDVDDRLLNNYTLGSEINYTDHHPNYTIVKYADSNKVYRLEPPSSAKATEGVQVKRWIVDEATFNSLNFRWDRILTILNTEVYSEGAELKK